MGSGCAFVDLTGDGLPDVYLVNGAALPGAPVRSPPGNAFYRNGGDGTFADITRSAGLQSGGYGIGCCAGDFDSDGLLDLYVTQLGTNILYRSEGDGRFTDVTALAGVGCKGFSTGAAFADYDNDGDLDLYVCRYVEWSPETDVECTARDGEQLVRVYCRPNVHPAAQGVLYRNDGRGRFADVTRDAGLAMPGRALGCLWIDVDLDGDLDLFVANDMSPNFLFINDGRGRFRESGLQAGVAVAENGKPQASMGVASVDFDRDGLPDLACTNFSGEYLALYRNLGRGAFEDVSARSGLVQATSPYVGFGLGFPDLDLNGWPDLFLVNGHVTEAAERFYPGVSFAQPSLCLMSDGWARFQSPKSPCPVLSAPRVSRGLAFADFDGDGDQDILVNNWRGTPDLIESRMPHRGNWIRLSLVGASANRSAIGARVEVSVEGATQSQQIHSGGSYCSQSELTLVFGLGQAGAADSVRVHWPGGKVEAWKGLSSGGHYQLVQGRAPAAKPARGGPSSH